MGTKRKTQRYALYLLESAYRCAYRFYFTGLALSGAGAPALPKGEPLAKRKSLLCFLALQNRHDDLGFVGHDDLRVLLEDTAQVPAALVAHGPGGHMVAHLHRALEQGGVPEADVVLRADLVQREIKLGDILEHIGLVIVLL